MNEQLDFSLTTGIEDSNFNTYKGSKDFYRKSPIFTMNTIFLYCVLTFYFKHFHI